MNDSFNEQEAIVELEKGYGEAEKILQDDNKLERFLQRLEKKLKKVPIAGELLSDTIVLYSLIKSYFIKEYTDIPIGTIIAIISALAYFISPLDLIPDSIPIVGYTDDLAVIAACWKLVKTDVDEYLKWREESGKLINV